MAKVGRQEHRRVAKAPRLAAAATVVRHLKEKAQPRRLKTARTTRLIRPSRQETATNQTARVSSSLQHNAPQALVVPVAMLALALLRQAKLVRFYRVATQ